MIQALIFFGAPGNELFCHEGFIAKDDSLKKWTELGVSLRKGCGKLYHIRVDSR